MVKTPLYRVKVFKTNEDGVLDGTSTTLSTVLNIQVMKGIDKTKDTFSFEIPTYKLSGTWYNTPGKTALGNQPIKVNDIVSIEVKYTTDSAWNDTHLLIFGNVRKLVYTDDIKRNRIKIEGVNRTEELLKGMIPYTTVGTGGTTETADTIIMNIFKRLNIHNTNYKIFVARDTETILETGTTGGIATTKSDGITPLDSKEYLSTWKPIYMQMEDLSKQQYTGDTVGGQYVFYVKPVPILPKYQNPILHNGPWADVLYWHSVGTTTSGNIVEGSGITGFSISQDVRNVINAAIVNAGTDLNGAGNLGVVYDIDSIGKYGAKWIYYTQAKKKFGDIYKDERQLAESQGSTFDAQTGFPAAGQYPWYFQYKQTVTTSGKPSDGGNTATDDIEFNDGFRYYALELVKAEALNMISFNQKATYEVSFDLETGSNEYVMGNIYNFQIPSFGWDGTTLNPGKFLRLRDETHIISSNGWQTRIIAREDETTVQENVEENN